MSKELLLVVDAVANEKGVPEDVILTSALFRGKPGDRAAIEAAKISLGDAITTALKQVDGTLDDAELEEQGGRHVWQVTIDTTDRGGVEVDVDVESGQATVATDDDSDD